MRTWTFRLSLLTILAGAAFVTAAEPTYTWRYYRPSNTGIQGDYCDALWIGPDGDPWIGGYNPGFEEGGIAKFVQAENRWINVSNVDYPAIGHPQHTGTSRVSEIVVDGQGVLWMGTGRGALKFDPRMGPSSLVRYDASVSSLPGGWTEDVEIAPDGTLWFSTYSTAWGGGGVSRFNPATGAWNTWTAYGGHLAAQPRPGGGYYIWTGNVLVGGGARFDSTTQSWTSFPRTTGNPAALPGKDCADDAGNVWMMRMASDYVWTIDCLRPDGTWINPPPTPGEIWAIRAFGVMQALVADGNSRIWRFNGTSWQDLGIWRAGAYTSDVAIDAAGNVWACGAGGAARRDAATGVWQRYRVTNTSQYDFFNRGLTVDPHSNVVYATANAGPGFGGMVKYDGTRWIGFNNDTYGLGVPWPFPTDNSEAVCFRPSSGHIVVNPMFSGIHEYDGASWRMLQASGRSKGMVEDSLGRLWSINEYFDLRYHAGTGWTPVPIVGWGQSIQKDPSRPGTIWAATGHEVVRTDGSYRFARQIGNFPELTTQSDTFSGLAADRNGIAWIGATVQFGAGGTGGALIRLDANTGAYQMLRYDRGWPLPGKYVSPLAVTPDGRIWMQYDTDYLTAQRGLCWYDGTSVGVFPAPGGGEPQWGGLPHAQIADLKWRSVPNGYELWMSCMSRGIAVLTVRTTTAAPGDMNCDGLVNFDDIDGFVLAMLGEAAYLAVYPDCFVLAADANGDGVVSFDDLDSFVALMLSVS